MGGADDGSDVPPAAESDGGVYSEPADDVVGRTGARFGPYSARRAKQAKRGKRSSVPIDGEGEAASVDGGASYQSGLRGFGVSGPVGDEDELPPLPWASAIVRPYAHTGGRTRSSHDLALEALISVGEWVEAGSVTPQRRMIMDLCSQPRSVAEVAALLGVPLGVARVLLGDLATDGAVVVHATGSTDGDVPDLDFMQRVLTGLRRL